MNPIPTAPELPEYLDIEITQADIDEARWEIWEIACGLPSGGYCNMCPVAKAARRQGLEGAWMGVKLLSWGGALWWSAEAKADVVDAFDMKVAVVKGVYRFMRYDNQGRSLGQL